VNNIDLKRVWEQTFKKAPNDEIIEMIGEYAASCEEHERVLLWLLMKSSTQIFRHEYERAQWVCERIKEHHLGADLPGLNNPMRAA
jgi:hypothetical protein